MTFLEFKKAKEFDGYNVWNKKTGEIIGEIYYYPQWKKLIFGTIEDDIVLSGDCLIDIGHFINKLDKEMKAMKGEKND